MVGRRSPQSPSISRLTLQPETIPSCYRRLRQTNSNTHRDSTSKSVWIAEGEYMGKRFEVKDRSPLRQSNSGPKRRAIEATDLEKQEAEQAILREWDGWAPKHLNPERPTTGRDGLTFFTYLQKSHPGLLIPQQFPHQFQCGPLVPPALALLGAGHLSLSDATPTGRTR